MWPFKRKKKDDPALPEYDPYVRATEAGLVLAVQTGRVLVGGTEYGGMKATLVVPGQTVEKNQPIGKKP